MTACLVYPNFNTYSSFRPLQGGHQVAASRGHHPAHSRSNTQEAVDLRQGVMLEETTSSTPMSSLYPLAAVASERIFQSRRHHHPSSHLQMGERSSDPMSRSAFTPCHDAQGPTTTTTPPPPPSESPASPPSTPQHVLQQHRALLMENGGLTSPLSSASSSVGADHQHHSSHQHDDAKSRQSAVSSPHSAILSDNEDEYIDMDMACDKSDSSGDSPSGKREAESGRGGGGGASGDAAGTGGNGSGEKKIYRCQHCKYITDRKNNLKRHVVTMHEMCPKTLECCDVVFKNKASLRDHVVSCHKNGYDCRICGRTFCRKALLKRHITVHSGQKDYICGVCGYATSHKSNLDRHKRRHGPKFDDGTGSDIGGRAGSKSPCMSPSSPQTTPQSPPFPSHKSNPLDVSNLVNNNNNNNVGSSSKYHHVSGYHHGSMTAIHRPEPLKPDLYCSPPPPGVLHPGHHAALTALHLNHHPAFSHPHHHPAAGLFNPAAPPPPPHSPSPDHSPRRRIRQHHAGGKYILSKRLLYTYHRDDSSSKTDSNVKSHTDAESDSGPHADGYSDSDTHKISNNNNYDYDAVRFLKQNHQHELSTGESEDDSQTAKRRTDEDGDSSDIERKVRIGLQKRMTTKRLLSTCQRRQFRLLSTKRLFPALYMCRRCTVVYENQLQLTEHVERDHRDDDCPQLPQRPLTLQARPRAW